MKKHHLIENHHVLYREVQRKTLGVVWDDTTISLPVDYHRKITKLQRKGAPSITTLGIIELDKGRGKI